MRSYVGEAIRPVAETFDAARMAAGGPGLPGEFVWRDRRVRVQRVIGEWRETAPCRHGSGERYVSRHWFDVLADDGSEMRLYFERRARGRALAARWWLFSVTSVLCALISAFGAFASEPVSEKSMEARIADRCFPSVFQAWNPAENLKEDRTATAARHDLIFGDVSFFGLCWDAEPQGLAVAFTPASILRAREKRRALMRLNPNLILLVEIRYRDAHRSYLPDGHAWWRRDREGKIVAGWEEGGYLQLDFGQATFREQVAKQAQAAVASGAVDGVMLDWWQDDADRLALVRAIRARIGEKALILVNANDRRVPLTAPFINGLFMECCRSATAADWARIAETLSWAEAHLRPLRINCLETWYHASRADENLMRCTTTLALALSDGYCLFSDPNPLPTPDHLHNWYAFWGRELGRPLGRGQTRPDGALERAFEGGTAVCTVTNTGPVTVAFGEPRLRRSTGQRACVFTVEPRDGDLFMRAPMRPPDAAGPSNPRCGRRAPAAPR